LIKKNPIFKIASEKGKGKFWTELIFSTFGRSIREITITITMAKIRFTLPVKEKIAQLIGTYFTTKEIANIFNDANIFVDESLFAKWRITLDAFSKMSDPESAIPRVLETFCHPLNLQHAQDPFYRDNFISSLNEVLAYANLKMQANNRTAEIISLEDGTSVLPENSTAYKTSTDYIYDALNFFKNEYNKVKISGLAYEYFLGEDICFDEHSKPEYQDNLIAIKRLKEAGFIMEYEIKVENNDAGGWVFAVCKIDESKITKKEEPPATEAGVREIIQKVEITAMPEVLVRNIEDNSLVKGKKRIHLPQFKETPWKDVEIRFLDEHNVHIKGGNKTAIADYEGLGFSNEKSKKPNLAWNFLLQMAKNKGETLQIPSPVPDNIKQIKRQISDFLKKLFKNETEPFHDISETRTYKLKIALIPPQTDAENEKDELGIGDYLNETMVSKYEPPQNENEW